ncbi:hypothetical protein CL653_03145 [bacterium]|nr:hypothetical protein [bacterium]
MILWLDKEKTNSLVEDVVSNTHSSFYKNRLAQSRFDESKDIEDLPTLDRSDLVSVHPDKRLYIPDTDVAFVAYTSGTSSGQPLISYFSEIENYHIDPTWGTSIKRPLVVFPPLNKTFGGTFVQQCRQSQNPCTPLFGSLDNLPASAYLATEVKSDALYTTPSLAVALAPHLKKHYTVEAVKLLVISGESIGESKLMQLRHLYPNALLANLYASSEIGQFIMGPTLEMMKDGVLAFRPLKEALVALELIEGELVVTYALNKAFPLIRYRTGDYFKHSPELSAKYGEGLPILEWSGKGGVDVVRVHGMEIRTGSVDDFFASLSQTIEDYQLHIFPEASDNVSLVIEVVGVSDEVADIVRESFLHSFTLGSGTVSDAMQKDKVTSVIVKVVATLSYQGNKRRVLISHV